MSRLPPRIVDAHRTTAVLIGTTAMVLWWLRSPSPPPGLSGAVCSWTSTDSELHSLPCDDAASRPELRPALTGQFDLNHSHADILEALPKVGPARARALRAYVTEKGPVESVDALSEVSGIGQDTLRALRPYVVLETSAQTQGSDP